MRRDQGQPPPEALDIEHLTQFHLYQFHPEEVATHLVLNRFANSICFLSLVITIPTLARYPSLSITSHCQRKHPAAEVSSKTDYKLKYIT